MQTSHVKRLSETRLHLQHGPIDLLIHAEGDVDAAFEAVEARFQTVLTGLVAELPQLRQPLDGFPFKGSIARRMADAVRSHGDVFVTPMAAVAGAVADDILATMVAAAPLTKAAVNNGGDIALHLAPGARFTLAMASASNSDLGRIGLTAEDGIGGIATSGRHGRSLSLGVSDSVTTLARSAAAADVAATLIANAVDLPGHPAIARKPAQSLDPDSDLGGRLVVTRCGDLELPEIDSALERGQRVAETMRRGGQISAAALYLQGRSQIVGAITSLERPSGAGVSYEGEALTVG